VIEAKIAAPAMTLYVAA